MPHESPDPDESGPVFEPWESPERGWLDDPDPTPVNLSTYPAAMPGPKPTPEWVITDGNALDTEIGQLNGGKEAEVFLAARQLGDQTQPMALKRYRSADRRAFRNDARYTARRRTGTPSVDKALRLGNQLGRNVQAAMWAEAEFEALGQLWSAGAAVPYPIQLLGTEVTMEFIGDLETGQAAPRLAEVRPTPGELQDLFDQARGLLMAIADLGLVHGDLSPYNLLVWDGCMIAIDMPQANRLDLSAADFGLLRRDVLNVATWFRRRGLDVDLDALEGEVTAAAVAAV